MPKTGKETGLLAKLLQVLGILILGAIIGVVACNWSYFKLDDTIEVSDILGLVVTSILAIYISRNIQQNISRRQNEYVLLLDEVKKIILHIEKFEVWQDNQEIPFEDGKKFFKKGTALIQECSGMFSNSNVYDKSDFEAILRQFNGLKRKCLDPSPVSGIIAMDARLLSASEKHYKKIRNLLQQIMIP